MTLLEWPDRATGFLPADRLDIALTLCRSTDRTSRSARVTGYGSFARARRAHPDDPPISRPRRIRPGRTPAHPGRRLDAQLRAAGAAKARNLHPDEFAEDGRTDRRCATASPIANRASGRERDAVHRHGACVARARAFGAGDICRRPRRGPAGDRRPRRRGGRWRRPAGAESMRATRRQPSLLAELHREAAARAVAGRARRRIPNCRATTWKRC